MVKDTELFKLVEQLQVIMSFCDDHYNNNIDDTTVEKFDGKKLGDFSFTKFREE